MKVLKSSVNYLTALGICSQRLTEPTNEFLKSFPAYISLLAYLGPIIPASIVFIFRNYHDFQASVKSVLVLSGGFAALGTFVSMGINMRTVKRLCNEFQALTDRGTS